MPFPAINVTPGSGATINTLPNAGVNTAANSLPVVLASDQASLAVFASDTIASGSLAALNATIVLTMSGNSGASYQLSGTWVGTVTFEATLDAITWFSVNAVSASTSTPTPTTTANGLYRLTPGGLMQVRARMSLFTSGSATVSARASLGTGGVFANQILPTKITDGVSIQTIKPASTAAVAADQAAVVGIHPTSNTVQAVSGTSGGCSTFHLINSIGTNSNLVKNSAGQVYGFQFTNTNTAARYVKFYNSATAVTAGSGTPVKTVGVPGGSATQPGVRDMAQLNGIAFSNGIAITITGGMADADATVTTANDLLCEIDFK